MSTSNSRKPDIVALANTQRSAVRRLLSRMVPESEVDDLVQEVFLKADKGLDGFRSKAAVSTWLHMIARNTALDHLARRRHKEDTRTVPLDAEEGSSATADGLVIGPDAHSRLDREEMCSCIREHVQFLPAEYVRVIELADIAELSTAEIAARLGISVGAAKIRLHRARAALRALLDVECELYHNTDGTLSCDRIHPPRVSVDVSVSSNGMKPVIESEDSGDDRPELQPNTNMTNDTSCGCSNPFTCQTQATGTIGSLFTAQASEFVSIGAAIGANCEPCLRFHTREALKVGIPIADIKLAVDQALRVKETPAQNIIKLAERLIASGGDAPESQASATSSCACSR